MDAFSEEYAKVVRMPATTPYNFVERLARTDGSATSWEVHVTKDVDWVFQIISPSENNLPISERMDLPEWFKWMKMHKMTVLVSE